VLGRHLQKTGMPMGVPDEAMATLNKGGIRRVVVGHTPHGTCPTIIKTGGPGMEEPGLVVVMADTSYSDMKAPDNRGRAVSEVLLLDNGQMHVHGRLPDLRELRYSLPDGVGGVEHPEMVGWDLPQMSTSLASAISPDVPAMLGDDAFFVKAFLDSDHDQAYMLQHVNGFVNKYVFLRPNEVARIFEAQRRGMSSRTSVSEEAEHPPSNEPSMPYRQALLTMHMLSDEEGADHGSEMHEFALQALNEQMSTMFMEGADTLLTTSENVMTASVQPAYDAMPQLIKGMLDSVSAVATGESSTDIREYSRV